MLDHIEEVIDILWEHVGDVLVGHFLGRVLYEKFFEKGKSNVLVFLEYSTVQEVWLYLFERRNIVLRKFIDFFSRKFYFWLYDSASFDSSFVYA